MKMIRMFAAAALACMACIAVPAMAQSQSCTTLPGLSTDYDFKGQPSMVGGTLHTVYVVTVRPGASEYAQPQPYVLASTCYRFTREAWDMVNGKPVSRSSPGGTATVVPKDSAVLRRVAEDLASQGK